MAAWKVLVTRNDIRRTNLSTWTLGAAAPQTPHQTSCDSTDVSAHERQAVQGVGAGSAHLLSRDGAKRRTRYANSVALLALYISHLEFNYLERNKVQI